MSTPDKCPNCGNPVKSDIGAGDVLYGCGTASQHLDSPSDLCRERAANAETRKRTELFENQLKHVISQRDFWEKWCDEKDAEIAKEHAAHAETRKERDELRSWFKAAQDNYESVLEQLTREREKWEKLRAWAGANFHFDEDPLLEMNRLDAEAKGGR